MCITESGPNASTRWHGRSRIARTTMMLHLEGAQPPHGKQRQRLPPMTSSITRMWCRSWSSLFLPKPGLCPFRTCAS